MTPDFNSLWQTRRDALKDITTALRAEATMTARLFGLVDECIADYEKFFISNSELALVSALVTTKGRNLALGSLSVALDGLAQEAGALLRPLLEAIELLAYFRSVPGAVRQALDDRLPTAGKRAKKINGKFQQFRDHLNQHASHLAFSYPALRHLIDVESSRLRVVQPHRETVLRANLASLALFTGLLAAESAQNFEQCSRLAGTVPVTAESLRMKVQCCRNEALHLFYPDEARNRKFASVRLPRGSEDDR